MTLQHDLATLHLGLDHVRTAPAHEGTLDLIVRRPEPGHREELEEGALDSRRGSWATAGAGG